MLYRAQFVEPPTAAKYRNRTAASAIAWARSIVGVPADRFCLSETVAGRSAQIQYRKMLAESTPALGMADAVAPVDEFRLVDETPVTVPDPEPVTT